MERFFEIILFIAGLFFLWLTYKMYTKEWKSPTWICALLGLLALLGTQDWIQGFFKTGILSLGYEYGDRLDKYQETVGRIETTVRQHQQALNQQQQNLLDQQTRISDAQNKIHTQQNSLGNQQKLIEETQEDISRQQEQIADVEFLVQNLFSKTRNETFRASDTNRFCHVKHGDEATLVCFLLEEPAVINSINGYYDNNPMKPIRSHFSNVMWTIIVGKWKDIKKIEYNITYVADTRDAHRFSKMEVIDDEIYIDGELLPFPYDHGKSKQVEPIVTTPADEVEAQCTQAHP